MRVGAHGDALYAAGAEGHGAQVRAVELLFLYREVPAGAGIEVLPVCPAQSVRGAGAMLCGDVLLDRVFVGMHDAAKPARSGCLRKSARPRS